jgi:hypothetical protein
LRRFPAAIDRDAEQPSFAHETEHRPEFSDRDTLDHVVYLGFNLLEGIFMRPLLQESCMIRAAGVLCIWLSIVCSPAFAATCWLPPMRPLPDQTIQRDMLVVSGKRCSLVVILSPGPMPSVRLIAPPRSGRVSIRGGRITYAARPGYVGDDHFIFAREGINAMYRRVTWTVEMNVLVKKRL